MEAHPISWSTEPEAELVLVRRARRGDREAFERLYRRHVGRIHALCRRMTADPHRSEDLTQEIFIRVWERLGSLREESRFIPWLRQLAVNMVLGERRTRGRYLARISPVDDLSGFPERTETRRSETAPDLERAIAGLPDGARMVFLLHDVEGYRHEEIARMSGRSTGTCKAQLHRARKLLREVLKK